MAENEYCLVDVEESGAQRPDGRRWEQSTGPKAPLANIMTPKYSTRSHDSQHLQECSGAVIASSARFP